MFSWCSSLTQFLQKAFDKILRETLFNQSVLQICCNVFVHHADHCLSIWGIRDDDAGGHLEALLVNLSNGLVSVFHLEIVKEGM